MPTWGVQPRLVGNHPTRYIATYRKNWVRSRLLVTHILATVSLAVAFSLVAAQPDADE